MAAPQITFTASGSNISGVPGFDCITVTFSADIAYTAFECRATKIDEEYSVGKGKLVASFSATPANVVRSFDVYDDYLVHGDGEYRISLYAKGADGSWNDNYNFIPAGSTGLLTSDGKKFLVMREVMATNNVDVRVNTYLAPITMLHEMIRVEVS